MNIGAVTEEVTLIADELSRAVELTLNPAVSHDARNQAYNACESFKENSPWCAQAGLLLASGNQYSAVVKHFGLQLMEHTVKYRWTQITQAEKIFIKESAMKLLYMGGWETGHLNDALARVIVEMIKREWPQQWPTLLAELSDACARGHLHTQIVLHVFLRLVEDVATLQTLEQHQRRKDIYQALTSNMAEIFAFFMRLIELHVQEFREKTSAGDYGAAASNGRVVQVVLLTLTGFVEWVSTNHVVMNDGRLLQILCILLQDDVFQLPAAECLLQVVNRKGSLWDLRGTMRSYRFQGHDEAVMDVTFSPTGKYMASASRDKTVRLWVPTVTGSTGVFKAHSQTVRSVQFSPDSGKILTASDDKIVKMWSSEKHEFLASFVGHTNWVRCARMSHDGSVIASCSDDKTTRLWNPDTGECIHTYKDQKSFGMCLSWHPSGCYIAIGTTHGNVKVYDIRTHNLVQYYSIHSDAVTQLTFHPSGSYILTSSKDGKMKILDLLEGHPIFTLSGHGGPVNTVNFSNSGDSFASAGEDKLVFIWRTNFTEFANETKENDEQNQLPTPKLASQNAPNKMSASTVRKNQVVKKR